MFAHHQGGLLNAAQLARGLGVSAPTVAAYLDPMVDLPLFTSLAPAVERGFHTALDDLEPTRALVVYPGDEPYRLAPSIEAVGLAELCERVRAGHS
jgi:hypothetical protein